jgi:hypothetical protein
MLSRLLSQRRRCIQIVARCPIRNRVPVWFSVSRHALMSNAFYFQTAIVEDDPLTFLNGDANVRACGHQQIDSIFDAPSKVYKHTLHLRLPFLLWCFFPAEWIFYLMLAKDRA